MRITFLPLLLMAGCTQPACRPMLEANLYFGLPDPAAFAAFLDTEVTPRFPEGLTAVDATGRWRTPAGRLTRETSKLVMIVAPDNPDTIPNLQAIRTAYRTQFNQHSVGLTLKQACADF